ncbi:MAG TPA: hypothetical protein VF042_14505 [Gemmatimonadaceae bacterium]
MRALRTAVLAVASLVIGACASSGTNAAAGQRSPAVIVVDNEGLLDMTIYVLRGSQRVRIGTATGLSRTRMTIPVSLTNGVTSLRFVADPIGGTRNSVSEEITISEGEELGLRIPPG